MDCSFTLTHSVSHLLTNISVIGEVLNRGEVIQFIAQIH